MSLFRKKTLKEKPAKYIVASKFRTSEIRQNIYQRLQAIMRKQNNHLPIKYGARERTREGTA